jgi:hypothetical protein
MAKSLTAAWRVRLSFIYMEYLHGADRDRTGDPLVANQVLSQLSYRPSRWLINITSGDRNPRREIRGTV